MSPLPWSAALAALTGWFLAVTGGILLVSLAIGWCLQHLVPLGQDTVPRSLVRTWALSLGLSVGAVCGLQTGLPHAALVFGDRLVRLPAEAIAVPINVVCPAGRSCAGFPAHAAAGGWKGPTAWLAMIDASAREEADRFADGGFLPYVIGDVLLGHIAEPVRIVGTLGAAYVAELREHQNTAGAVDAVTATWTAARPELAASARRASVVSIALSVGTLGGYALLGTVLLLAYRGPLRRRARARATYAARDRQNGVASDGSRGKKPPGANDGAGPVIEAFTPGLLDDLPGR